MADKEPPRKPGHQQAKALLASAQAGSRSSLGRLLKLYEPLLLSIANGEIDADLKKKGRGSDLVQTTMLEAIRDFTAFKSKDPNELLGWLTELLRNNIRDLRKAYRNVQARQISRERSFSSSNVVALLDIMAAKRAAMSTGEPAVDPAAIQRLRHALEKLQPAERRLLEWRYFRKMSYVKMAEKLGKTPDAVRVACNRIVVKLRDMLGPSDGE